MAQDGGHYQPSHAKRRLVIKFSCSLANWAVKQYCDQLCEWYNRGVSRVSCSNFRGGCSEFYPFAKYFRLRLNRRGDHRAAVPVPLAGRGDTDDDADRVGQLYSAGLG